MLSAHAPLITYKVSLACKDYRRNPRAPVVLSELLNRCEESTVFAQVQHIVPELLLALDRNDQVWKGYMLAEIFFELNACLGMTSGVV